MAELIDDREGHEWRVLYRVAQTAATAQDLPSFYRAMHAIVRELMNATNSGARSWSATRPSA